MVKLFGDELLNLLKITASYPRTKTLELVRVSPENVRSKHILICNSGFLQEGEDKRDTWKCLPQHFKHSEVYGLSWTACSYSAFFEGGHFNKGEKVSGMKKFLNVANLWSSAHKQYIFAYD